MKTFQEQFKKLTQAYINNEVKPYNAEFCFCGNLMDKNAEWRYEPNLDYSRTQFLRMEAALLETLRDETIGNICHIYGANRYSTTSDTYRSAIEEHPNYEEALFNGFQKALDVLKDIHILRGEIVDSESIPEFKKREFELELV